MKHRHCTNLMSKIFYVVPCSCGIQLLKCAWYEPISYWFHDKAACSFSGVNLRNQLDHMFLSRLTDGTAYSSWPAFLLSCSPRYSVSGRLFGVQFSSSLLSLFGQSSSLTNLRFSHWLFGRILPSLTSLSLLSLLGKFILSSTLSSSNIL